MHDLTPRLVAILQKYMRDPAVRVASSMALSELDIDLFDLPLIYLDVEDAFDVHIGAGDELEEPVTVEGLVGRVASCLAARALPGVRTPRRKGSWMSTGAERRR